jgi:hypothetical protein
MSGSNISNQNGVYGTKGVAASANVPGARCKAVSWIDSSNNLWLFGGWGYAATGYNGMPISFLKIKIYSVLYSSKVGDTYLLK